jgi:hypothetical protein
MLSDRGFLEACADCMIDRCLRPSMTRCASSPVGFSQFSMLTQPRRLFTRQSRFAAHTGRVGALTAQNILDAPSTPVHSPSYPRGPYNFYNREYFIVPFETTPDAIRYVWSCSMLKIVVRFGFAAELCHNRCSPPQKTLFCTNGSTCLTLPASGECPPDLLTPSLTKLMIISDHMVKAAWSFPASPQTARE